jgi:hypothetical protein
MRVMGRLHDFLTFANDAEVLAMWGGACLAFAAVCSLMERRRMRRTQIDRVGWVPWTGLFLAFAVFGGGCLAVAVPVLLKG